MADATESAARYRAGFVALLAAVFSFRLWFITTLPLSGDEAYHWEWSRHLAFGYYDHPGLTAYLIRLSTWAFGRSTEFTVRLPALVMLTGTAAVCFLWAESVLRRRGVSERLAGRAGFLAGLLVLVTPIFAFLSVYISTDPPAIFFSALAMTLYYRALNNGGWVWWIGGGAAAGLALMSKFLGGLLIPSLALFVLLGRENRRWIVRPEPWVSALCALAVWSPFLWWNAQNHWVTFLFNFVFRQEDLALNWKDPLEFIGGQALALSPVLFLLAAGGLWYCLRWWWVGGDRDLLFLGLGGGVPFVYFLAVSVSRSVGLHWPAAGWIPALVMVAVSAVIWPAADPRRLRGFVRLAVAVAVILTAALHGIVYGAARVSPAALKKWEWSYARNPDRITTGKHAELFGWRELGERVDAVRGEMLAAQGESRRGVFVMTGHYGLSASVAFYTPSQCRTHLWASRKVHGENYRFWDDYPSMKGSDALFVAKTEENAAGALRRMRKHFREVAGPETLSIRVDNEEVRRFYLVRCFEYDGQAPEFRR